MKHNGWGRGLGSLKQWRSLAVKIYHPVHWQVTQTTFETTAFLSSLSRGQEKNAFIGQQSKSLVQADLFNFPWVSLECSTTDPWPYLLAPPASGDTMMQFFHSGMFSRIHWRTAGSAYRLSTAMSKNPWRPKKNKKPSDWDAQSQIKAYVRLKCKNDKIYF